MEAWTGLIRLRTGAGGGAVVKVVMNLRFHTVRVTFRRAEKLLASQEELRSTEYVRGARSKIDTAFAFSLDTVSLSEHCKKRS